MMKPAITSRCRPPADQIGSLGENRNVTFGRTYAAEPDALIEQLKADAAIEAADTLLITIPNTMGGRPQCKILPELR